MTVYTAIGALLGATDGVIKYAVERNHPDGVIKPALDGKIMLRKFHNKGAMLNLGASRQQTMAVISVAFTLLMTGVYIGTLTLKGRAMLKTGLALILGGAYSNTYDRLFRKYVVDYVSFEVPYPRLRRIVFNLADFGIIIGSLLLVLSEMKDDERCQRWLKEQGVH